MYTLRPYQQEAVSKTINYFKKKRDPALIVLPTGAGKSLVIAEMARVASGRVLVLAHVKELVEQNHQKYQSYNLEAGIYSAGLDRKDSHQKVIFGSIQSVARADSSFFEDFNLVIIDECHRVSEDSETQYMTVLNSLRENNPNICILGLTATPYRLGLGWIYKYSMGGEVKTEQERFFKYCLYELPITYMIKEGYLTKPVKIDIPVTCYDFSDITHTKSSYTYADVEKLLKEQKRLTPLIIKNIVDITEKYKRQGVMIFSSTINHAKEILSYLPEEKAEIVIGETAIEEREEIINRFKAKEIKYLVNVSVLTTGFDAPHVDVIALLRPTESASLYQQIVGRGLRLSPGKKDCFILDYTGMDLDIYTPEIAEKKPTEDSQIVLVSCPSCGFENEFWGKATEEGDLIEHYGRKCKGVVFNEDTLQTSECGYRFRFKLCPSCGAQNDIGKKECSECKAILTDAEAKLKEARLSKDAHILKPDTVEMNSKTDKKGNPYLEIKYYDYDAKALQERYYLNNETSVKKFNINFVRSHSRRPELEFTFTQPEEVIKYQALFRTPSFIIARKQDHFWRITEKIFTEELR